HPPALPGLRRGDDGAGQCSPAHKPAGKIAGTGLSLAIGPVDVIDYKDRVDTAPSGNRIVNEVCAGGHPDGDYVSKRCRYRAQRQDCPPGYGLSKESARMISSKSPDG